MKDYDYEMVTARARRRYDELSDAMHSAPVPVFLNHDSMVAEYWDQLPEVFPDYQFILVDPATKEPVGRGQSIPLSFNGSFSALPHGGFDWVIERGFLDHSSGIRPNVLSAVFITTARRHVGSGISYRVLDAMKSIGKHHGFNRLIAPVRPTLKSAYPLIPMEEYCRWSDASNLPFDPWIRVHVRAGGTLLHPCHEAMVVRGTVRQWAEWTELEFPGSGQYIVPGALVPIQVDIVADTVIYVEPGIWLLHDIL